MASPTLLEQQVDLTRAVLEQLHGMDQHLLCRVLPHLGAAAREVVHDLLEALDVEEGIDPNIAYYVDATIAEVRAAIAAQTTKEEVAIPRERLIGCTEAFETRTSLSPAAEALKAALPPLVSLYRAARQAVDFAEAIRLSIQLLHPN
ncbi:hypothetical protein [Jannaschia seosinensis]|nr:hypothetical protein [Jannaschia seosinensis]